VVAKTRSRLFVICESDREVYLLSAVCRLQESEVQLCLSIFSLDLTDDSLYGAHQSITGQKNSVSPYDGQPYLANQAKGYRTTINVTRYSLFPHSTLTTLLSHCPTSLPLVIQESSERAKKRAKQHTDSNSANNDGAGVFRLAQTVGKEWEGVGQEAEAFRVRTCSAFALHICRSLIRIVLPGLR
jgi:hypothetical protein